MLHDSVDNTASKTSTMQVVQVQVQVQVVRLMTSAQFASNLRNLCVPGNGLQVFVSWINCVHTVNTVIYIAGQFQ
jgi:hypothetical protein